MKRLAVYIIAAAASYAADFSTGQAARAVIGQTTFTQQDPTSSERVLGGVSGIAYANGTLFVADSNRAGATPNNNRVLIFRNPLGELASPAAEVTQTGRCPICTGTAQVALGQTDFKKTDFAVEGGLRLPTAVATDGTILVVADTDNNRVLIWRTIPTAMNAPPDIVLGQPDFKSSAPNNGTGDPLVPSAKTLRGPQGVWLQNGKLFVADDQNHRVLIWRQVPTQNFQAADVVLGQPNFTTATQPDLTKISVNVQPNTLLNPVSVTSDGTRLFVADLGHNRVLIWNSIPDSNAAAANVVIGQPSMSEEWAANNSSKLCASNGKDADGNLTYPARCAATVDFPRYALSDGKRLFIADGGNNRVLIFNNIPAANGQPADVVLGQYDFESDQNSDDFNPEARSSSDSIRTPSALAWDPVNLNLFVSDPYDRRVMVFSPADAGLPVTGVRNAGSLEIFAVGAASISGTITENDEITVTIKANADDTGKDYVYKVKKTDTLATVLTQLVNLINAGNGDPNVIASPNLTIGAIQFTARKGGAPGNSVEVAIKLSENATIVLPATTTLSGGMNAAKIAPGTIVSLLGTGFSDITESAPPGANPLPTEIAGVQVYFDGFRAPLLFVSPTQINAQVPFEVSDTTSITCWVRTKHSNGAVTVTNAQSVPIVGQNPGIFAEGGTDPRAGILYHFSSQATGTVSVDGSPKAGETATISIEDRSYTYTVKDGDTLETVRDALVALVNQDPKVMAFPSGVFTRVRLKARVAGPEGNNIPYAASASSGANVILTPANVTLCCANQAYARVTPENPAVPGETLVAYATGLGLVTQVDKDKTAITAPTGSVYTGPALNTPVQFMNAMSGGKTADVLLSAMKPGTVGTYEVHLQLNSDLPTNPVTQIWIAQDIYISNVVTFPLVNPNPATPVQ